MTKKCPVCYDEKGVEPMEIRELEYEDLETASRVLWKSYYEAEKNNTPMEGMEKFRDLTSPVSLSMNTFDGSVLLYGAFENEKLVGVGALKEKRHVLLLFVLPESQRRGVGAALLSHLLSLCTANFVTVNSSDFGVSFYQKFGFSPVAPRRVEEGLVFTPMQKRIK